MSKSQQLNRSFASRRPVRRSTFSAPPISTKPPALKRPDPSRSGRRSFRRARVRHRTPMLMRMKAFYVLSGELVIEFEGESAPHALRPAASSSAHAASAMPSAMSATSQPACSSFARRVAVLIRCLPNWTPRPPPACRKWESWWPSPPNTASPSSRRLPEMSFQTVGGVRSNSMPLARQVPPVAHQDFQLREQPCPFVFLSMVSSQRERD